VTPAPIVAGDDVVHTRRVPAFDEDQFIADCVAARADSDPVAAIADVVARAVSRPDDVVASVEFPLDPYDDGVIHRSPELLIVKVVFPAKFVTGIHDHRVPAVIGAWGGFEDNLLYRRNDGRLAERGVRRLEPRDVLVMTSEDVHDVHVPGESWTGALHVYLGDIESLERSGWDGPDAPEQTLDVSAMGQLWDELARDTGLV
jgi:predicted metal-dependent enzyme (double-stranded beta helix superfamily)